MRITGQQVIAMTAEHFGMTKAEMLTRSPRPYYARPRQVAMWLCRRHCPHLSYLGIARLLGLKDHTTIIHGIRAIDALILQHDGVAASVEALSTRICLDGEAGGNPRFDAFAHLCSSFKEAMRPAA